MKLVPISLVNSTDILARSVMNPAKPPAVVLKAGVPLNQRIITALRSSGYHALWVKNGGALQFTELLDDTTLRLIRGLCGKLFETLTRTQAESQNKLVLAVSPLDISALINALVMKRRIYCPADDIGDSRGSFLHHSVNVCILSLHIGLEIEATLPEGERKSADKLIPLGMGALLHDIGQLMVNDSVRYREPWELSRVEFETIQTHTTNGFSMLRPTLGAVVANMALCHHKNEDGSGYPNELAESGSHLPEGDQVHPFSRVVAVANAYEQLVCYCGYTSLEAIEEVNCARSHHFDPQVLAAFNRVVPALAPGRMVRLSTGHSGVVMDFNPDAPFCPSVLLTVAASGDPLKVGQFKPLDLRSTTHVGVTHLDGRNVSHLIPKNSLARWENLS